MVMKDPMALVATSRGFPVVLAKFPTGLNQSGLKSSPNVTGLFIHLTFQLKLVCGEHSDAKIAAVHHTCVCSTLVVVSKLPPSLWSTLSILRWKNSYKKAIIVIYHYNHNLKNTSRSFILIDFFL